MRCLLPILALFSLVANADIANAPPSFSHELGQAVFVDFLEAEYSIVYDGAAKEARVFSSIRFVQSEVGMPIFDLVENPSEVRINGVRASAPLVRDPDGESSFRVALKRLEPGEHILEIEHAFTANTEFTDDTAASGFWMSDLGDRKYLEQYLPSNLEFDRYPMRFLVEVKGTQVEHEVFANGKIERPGPNQFVIAFPEHYTASSVFFHLAQKGQFAQKRFFFDSLGDKKIPVLAYSKTQSALHNIDKRVEEILVELEQSFGPWRHASLIVYISGWAGGMEHAGATITSLSALGHELTHSYFGRGVMPMNGNSGWLDEAIASWRDNGYPAKETPYYQSSQMAGFSPYRRTTDRKAYSHGASFMSYLNHELQGQGGLKAFLSELYQEYFGKNLSTELFERELSLFSGRDFRGQFRRYVFGEEPQGN